MTNQDKILYAILRTHRKQITASEIVIATWRSYPSNFELEGFPEFPDSNKILALLMGQHGLVKKGYLKRVSAKVYEVIHLPKFELLEAEHGNGSVLDLVQADEVIITAILTSPAAMFLRDSKHVPPRIDDLIRLLFMVHNDPIIDPEHAIRIMELKLNDVERKQGSSDNLRFAKNVFGYLVEKFRPKLAVDAKFINLGQGRKSSEHVNGTGNKKADQPRRNRNQPL